MTVNLLHLLTHFYFVHCNLKKLNPVVINFLCHQPREGLQYHVESLPQLYVTLQQQPQEGLHHQVQSLLHLYSTLQHVYNLWQQSLGIIHRNRIKFYFWKYLRYV